MKNLISGLHHITALSSNPQKTVDFYAGILGLRLVKKTINFDAPEIYHLYFGDRKGSPGSILTFFPYVGIPRGRKGKGQLTTTSFSISENSLDYWMRRLEKFEIPYSNPMKRFNKWVIYFEDGDGLGLELVANSDAREGFTYGNVPLIHSIKGFFGMTLSEECYEKTAGLLVGQMNYLSLGEEGNRFRFTTINMPGTFVDILCSPDALQGYGGYGTVHHVAFATASDASQLEIRQKLIEFGLNVTPVLDRQYFHSIYFREPGGVLFEVATVPPGFEIDESEASLGSSLKLPSWEESQRHLIEQLLPPINLDLTKFRD